MNTRFLTAVSAIALLAAATPAYADPSPATEARAEASTTGNIVPDGEKAIDNAKEDIKDAYEDIKARFIDETDDGKFEEVTYRSNTTANGIIGKDIVNTNGDHVAKIEDVILDAEGNAALVIVADGGVLGLGEKLAAFDYSAVATRNEEGDVIAPISEETLKQAAAFTYDREKAAEKVKTVSTDGYSVKHILDGNLMGPDDKKVASVDNVTFRNGRSAQLLVGFDKVLGLGGQQASIDFSSLTPVRKDTTDDVDFKLSAAQAAQFESFKKTSTN